MSPTKSVGHGITCTADLKTEEEVWKVILELCSGHRTSIKDSWIRKHRVQIA